MSDALPARVSELHRRLAEAETLEDLVAVEKTAAAVKDLARHAGLSLERQNEAAEAAIRAKWAGGRLLRALERGQPGPDPEDMSSDGRNHSPYREALEAAGLSRQDANRWQKLAAFDEEELAGVLAAQRERGEEITTAYVLREWRREKKNPEPEPEALTLRTDDLQWLVDEGHTFGTIYADPPWQYGNQGTRGATGDHYPGMTPDEVADFFPIESLARDSAHLHLWTTNAFLFDARQVIEAWGFTYKSAFVWVKPQMGMGNYWRVSHEYCLLGVRGSASFRERDEMSWAEWPRGKHSAKPGRMYEKIERVSPPPYLELFARRVREGWVSWGNEIENDLFYQGITGDG